MYVSQDPIGLAGNNPNFYAYTYDSNSWVDPFGLDTFYQLLNNSGDVVYQGITERGIQDRLTEHSANGKTFTQVKYLEDLPNRDASRDLEGSSLYHTRQAELEGDGKHTLQNAKRKDKGYYHSYDPEKIKTRANRNFLSQAEIDAKMKNATTVQVDGKGKIKCN